LRVTVLLTCYNHELFIDDCFAALNENRHLIDELVICDDHSSDLSIKKIEKNLANFSCDIKRIYNPENIGVNATWNLAMQSISGDIIICQSCDDMSSVSRIVNAIDFFEKNSDVDFIVTNYQFVDSLGTFGALVVREDLDWNLEKLIVKGSSIPLFGMAFRNAFIKEIGILPESITNEDDYIGFVAIALSKFAMLNSCDYYYRVHERSMSNWTISSKFDVILSNFLVQQANRIANFKYIQKKVCSDSIALSDSHYKLFASRIQLHDYFSQLPDLRLLKRLSILLDLWPVLNKRDILVLLLGVQALWILSVLKKFRIRGLFRIR
jgi:glycosyltransferase involved in cell wall biosynthesis